MSLFLPKAMQLLLPHHHTLLAVSLQDIEMPYAPLNLISHLLSIVVDIVSKVLVLCANRDPSRIV